MLANPVSRNEEQVVYEYCQAMRQGDVVLAARILRANPDLQAMAKRVYGSR